MSHKKTCTVRVAGMTCKSCEVFIESRWKAFPGIHHVRADAHRGIVHIDYRDTEPSQAHLAESLDGTQYRIATNDETVSRTRLSAGRLLGVVVIAMGIALLFTKFGFLKGAGSLSSTIGVGGAFVLGLVAAASSCVATVGGLMITAVNQYQRRIPVITMKHRLMPVASFVAGRILSYAILGGILGAVGSAFSPSPAITGTIVIIAAVYMMVMGFDMLGVAPAFLKRLMPKMPKGIASRAFNAQSPFLLGAATFFIPCGFTQSLQIYALTTGSFGSSALILGAFALGTTPALGILGLSLSSFKGRVRDFVFQCAGALVLLMGIWNLQNGLTITGHPLNISWLKNTDSAQAQTKAPKQDAYVYFDGKEQIVRMKADYNGYTPSSFTIRSGVPTRWQIDGSQAYGCVSAFQVPALGVRRVLEQGINEIDFTAPAPGRYVFSCSMGMYRGIMNVVKL